MQVAVTQTEAVASPDAQQPPGPAPVRSLRARLWLMARFMRDPIGVVDERFARYGDLYRAGSQDAPLYVTRDPEHIRAVLVTEGGAFGKGHTSFRILRQVLGDSLLTSEGESWRRQRRLVQPAFARPRLAEYAAVMAEEATAEAERLAHGRPRQVDLSRAMTGLTLRIVARTLFGQSVDDSPRVGRAMRWLNEAFARPDVLPRFLPTPARRKLGRATRDLDDAVRDVLERRRQHLAAGGHPPADLLQRLLDARDDEGDGEGLSDREIRDQLLTLYLAGHDTTSHAVSWTLYLLSQHPTALARLRQELDDQLSGRKPTLDDLAALPYTECVFKEAMRLYPPVVALPRRAERDCRLGAYHVSRGSEAIVWIYHAHRNPRYYSEPERYRPERFEGPENDARPRHAYLPFGAGQRACIGQLFATMEAQIILASLVPRLELEYTRRRPPGLRFGVTLAPRGGLPMRIRRR